MGQEAIIASQEEALPTADGLFEHLNHLQRLNTRNVLDAVHQRQPPATGKSSSQRQN